MGEQQMGNHLRPAQDAWASSKWETICDQPCPWGMRVRNVKSRDTKGDVSITDAFLGKTKRGKLYDGSAFN